MIKITNLKKEFSGRVLFENVNLELNTGDFVSVIGKNGTGKTTLVKILMGLEKPTAGTVSFDKAKVKFGYVPQFRNIDADYPLSVKSFVELNLKKSGYFFKTKKDKQRLHDALSKTELLKIQNLPLGLISGGEKQKAYLAQAIINEPDVLILDESTASLDGSAKEKLMELVQKLSDEQKFIVIFVSHDYALAKKYTDKYLWFDQQTIVIKDISELDERVFTE